MSVPAEDERPARSFETFVAEHGDALVALARGLSARDEDADGLAERALAQALRCWSRLRRRGAGPEVVYGAVVRAMVALAPDGAEPAVVDTGDGEDVDLDTLGAVPTGPAGAGSTVGAGRDHDGVRDPVAALRRAVPSQRVVLLLRWLEDRGDAEIGELLQVSADEVAQRGALALEASGLAGVV